MSVFVSASFREHCFQHFFNIIMWEVIDEQSHRINIKQKQISINQERFQMIR